MHSEENIERSLGLNDEDMYDSSEGITIQSLEDKHKKEQIRVKKIKEEESINTEKKKPKIKVLTSGVMWFIMLVIMVAIVNYIKKPAPPDEAEIITEKIDKIYEKIESLQDSIEHTHASIMEVQESLKEVNDRIDEVYDNVELIHDEVNN